MLLKLTTAKTVSEAATALHAAVAANRFGVMHVHNLKETMAKKGVEFARECLVFEVIAAPGRQSCEAQRSDCPTTATQACRKENPARACMDDQSAPTPSPSLLQPPSAKYHEIEIQYCPPPRRDGDVLFS